MEQEIAVITPLRRGILAITRAIKFRTPSAHTRAIMFRTPSHYADNTLSGAVYRAKASEEVAHATQQKQRKELNAELSERQRTARRSKVNRSVGLYRPLYVTHTNTCNTSTV